jgi:hypothetical protein
LDRIPCIYDLDTGSKEVEFYTEGKYGKMDHDQWKIEMNNPNSKYIMVAKTKKGEDGKKSLEQLHNEFIEDATKMKELTGGIYNMFITGAHTTTVRSLFLNKFKPDDLPPPHIIAEFESEFMENCSNGGHVFGLVGTYLMVHKYDVNSQYPSILRSEHMQFPMKKGKLLTLTKKEFDDLRYYKYGIYRAKVMGNVDPRLFKLNQHKTDTYTHIDLNWAKQLKYTIEIIVDGKPNFVSYEGCLVNGARLFRKLVDYLYQFKKNGHKVFKKPLIDFHGKLCEKNHISLISKNDKPLDIFKSRVVDCILPHGKSINATSYMVQCYKIDNYYKTNYARILPFLIAKGRYMICSIAQKNLANVVRIATDGIVLTQPIQGIELGKDIGMLKYEGCCPIFKVKSNTTYDGIFYDQQHTQVKQRQGERVKQMKRINTLYRTINKL